MLVGRASDEEPTVLVLDVLGRRFEQVRRKSLGLFLYFPGRQDHCGARYGRGTASVCSPPHRGDGCVAMDYRNVVDVDADFRGDDLGESRLLTLTVRRRTDHYVDLAGGVEANDRALPQPALESDGACDLRWSKSTDLHIS